MFEDPASRFYPIIDTHVCEARGLAPRLVAAACLKGGARLLQLRVKTGGSASFLALADDVVAMAKARGATVIVNDRPDIARMSGAGGVHVGQEDVPPDEARVILGTGLVGLSTHDERQVDEALASSADYIAVGPVFGTATKDTGYSERGLGLVRYAVGRGKPVVSIGGIDLERAASVIEAGAAAVAIISDVLRDNPEARARAYLDALSRGDGGGSRISHV